MAGIATFPDNGLHYYFPSVQFLPTEGSKGFGAVPYGNNHAPVIGTLIMGLWANCRGTSTRMGLNAFLTFGVTLVWDRPQQALAAVFVAGILPSALSVTPFLSTLSLVSPTQ